MINAVNKVVFFTLSFLMISGAQAQNSSELTCRTKAKELAAQSYNSCVTEVRNSQIDQIRKDYQKQLADLKSKYDKELKKVHGKGPSLEASPVTVTTRKTPPLSASTGSVPKATKGIAKSLPTRKETKSRAPVVQNVVEDKPLLAPDSTTDLSEEASQNDAQGELKMQLVPAPATSDQTAASSEEPVY